jgi:tetratricopeptide (TPR) repeat protein
MVEFLIDQAMKEAIDLQNRNQLDDAKSIYNKILVHDKNNSDAHHLLSLIYLVEGKLDDARSHIINAIELQPEISVYHSNYGNILYQSNNLEFAIQEHKRAIKLDKKNFQSFYSLGVIYSHLKNYDKAVENYKKALSLDANSSVAHNNLANIYNNINPNEAEHHYLKVLELTSNDPMPYINISNYYLKNTKYKKCVEVLEEALNKDVTSKELYNNLGIAYYATKDNIAAKKMFKHALEIDNSYKPAIDNIKNMENAGQ